MSKRRPKIKEEPAPKKSNPALPLFIAVITIIAGLGVALYFVLSPPSQSGSVNIESGGGNTNEGNQAGSGSEGGNESGGTGNQTESSNPLAIMHVKSDDGSIDGIVKIELYRDKAPITVGNFINYTKNSLYDGTLFHRVEKDFVIQGGGYYPNGTHIHTYPPIKSEANNGLRNTKWTVAMALGSKPDGTTDINSATSEFFVNMNNNTHLDSMGFTVFGKVIGGFDILNQINNVKTQEINPQFHKPVVDIVVETVTIQGA